MKASQNTTCGQCGGTFEQTHNGARRYCLPCSLSRSRAAMARHNALQNQRIEMDRRQKYNEGYSSWLAGTVPPSGVSAALGVRDAARKYHHEKVVVASDEPDVMIVYDPTLAKDAVAEKPTFEEAIV